jgi:hypothetical protein
MLHVGSSCRNKEMLPVKMIWKYGIHEIHSSLHRGYEEAPAFPTGMKYIVKHKWTIILFLLFA